MALTTDNKSSRLFKALMGVSETRLARDFFEEPVRSSAAVLPNQVWKYGDRIPTGSEETGGSDAIDAVRALSHGQQYEAQFDEATIRPIVRKWVTLQMSPIDGGTDNAFIAKHEGNPVKNIVPFNFGDGVTYNYSLFKDNGSGGVGAPIAFGVGDWVLDPQSGVLTFYSDIPDGVDASTPPFITFYEYVGGFGIPETVSGYEGAVIPLTNFKGTINTASWNSQDTPTLDTTINSALNKVYADFLTTYGWDGADDNEGAAVGFEKLLPLRYTASQDPVKSGIGMNANAEVNSLIARRHVVSNLGNTPVLGLTVDFVNQKTPTDNGFVMFRYFGADSPNRGDLQMSIDSGDTWGTATSGVHTIKSGTAVKVKAGNAFAVVRKTGSLPTEDVSGTISISDATTTVGFFYWDSDLNDYVPWVLNDATSSFDFGIPIVLKLGKIPASVKLSQTSTGGFSDAITPEYYGVRPQSFVLAVVSSSSASNTYHPEGVDYLVKNETGFYLNEVLDKLFDENPDFSSGTIYLRAGKYQVMDTINLEHKPGIQILGEARDSTIIDSVANPRSININASSMESRVYFERLQFQGEFTITAQTTGTEKAYVSIVDVLGPDTDIVVNADCDAFVFNNPSLRNLSMYGTGNALGDRLIESSSFNAVVHNGSNVIYRSILAQSFDGQGGGTGSWIDGSHINNLLALDLDNLYSNNTVLAFDAGVDERYKMSTGKFEIIDEGDGPGQRRWVDFADPIEYDQVAKQFFLRVDDRTLEISGGKLFVKAAADVITFDNTSIVRPYDSIEGGGPDVTATNVQDALADLYATKADLVAGHIPLQLLPDTIVSGGLAYKGMWSFEKMPDGTTDNNTGPNGSGLYPLYTELSAYDFDNVNEEPGELQAGWFVVVKYSIVPDQPATPQEAEDGQFYTAGDWAVFNGTAWEKVDNSIADAVYSILPSTPPDGAVWDEASGGDGLLALGNTTLVEATDQINEILRKLAPPKPLNLNQMTLVDKISGEYTATDTATGVNKSKVWDHGNIRVGTPNGANDINHLFFDGDGGTLTAFIDDVQVGQAVLSEANDEGTTNALIITEDIDPHAGVSGKENFWKGLRADILPESELDLGEHKYRMDHTTSGTTADYFVHHDNPASTMSIASASIIQTPPMTKMLSGVPSVPKGAQFEISPFTAVGVVGTFYNSSRVASVACNVSGVSTKNLDPTSAPVLPALWPDPSSYEDAACANTLFTMPTSNAYEEDIEFTLTPYNSKGSSGTQKVFGPTQGFRSRIDTTTEEERVFSGSPTEKFPTIGTGAGECGAAFQSDQSLVSTAYEGELQKINGKYRWPAGDYGAYGGPNYTSATGSAIGGETGTWRWVTFRFDALLSNASAFTLDLQGATGGWNDDDNKITDDTLIFAKVVGASGTGWLNANDPYPGAGTPVGDNDPAMVAGDNATDANTKRVTFGAVPRTGTLYIRVGIKPGSRLFSGVSVGSIA